MTYEEVEQKDRVQKIHCETCDDLLEYLRPSHDRWLADDGQMAWLFRGHHQEEWILEPSALREKVEYFNPCKYKLHHTTLIETVMDEFIRPSDPVKVKRLSDLLTQAICEKTAILQFIEASDDVGLAIPDDHISRDFHLSDRDFLRKIFNGEWQSPYRRPPIDFVNFYNGFAFMPWYLHSDVVALAQHHGIPTRLLDWTENPWKAAYFAANDEADRKTGNIAIWAIHRATLSLSDLQMVKPRRNRIGFLHAQDGVFIYDVMGNKHYFDHGHWRTFENIIADLNDPSAGSGFPETEYWLRKITFPAAKAEELLLRLRAHKVEKRFLMPTYDNVARELHGRREIDARDWENKLGFAPQVRQRDE